MTLTTSIRIIGDVSPEGLFARCRSIIGIPADHPFTIDHGDIWTVTASEPGGFRSALTIYTARGGRIPAGDDGTPECDFDICLDTSYGCDNEYGSASENHHQIITELAPWLEMQGADWWAQDEWTGTWHHRTPCPILDAEETV